MAAAGRFLCLLATLVWSPSLGNKATADRRFSELKRCVDEECSMLLCRGKAVQDFTGPDCRFINFKKGETIYVYYKLAGRSSELWAGSVGSNFGYFPSHLLETNHVYTHKELELETDETDFVCSDGGKDNFDNYNVDELLSNIEEKEVTEKEVTEKESTQEEPTAEEEAEEKEATETESTQEEPTEEEVREKEATETEATQEEPAEQKEATETEPTQEEPSEEEVREKEATETEATQEEPPTAEEEAEEKEATETESTQEGHTEEEAREKESETEESMEPNTESSTAPEKNIKSSAIPEEQTKAIEDENEDLTMNNLNGNNIDEMPKTLVRKTQLGIDPASESLDYAEETKKTKRDDLSSESRAELQEEKKALHYSEENPQIPFQDLPSSFAQYDEPLIEEEPEDSKAYTLIDKEMYTDLKTQIGTTADAIVTDDELTRKVTSMDTASDEDEEADGEEMKKESDQHFTEPPLLAYEQETPVFSKESTQPSPVEEDPDALNETQTLHSDQAIEDNMVRPQEEAKPQSNEDDQENKGENVLTSWGDTFFAIVSGGEHTKDVTDMDGVDSDEEEEGDVTENKYVNNDNETHLLGIQETKVEGKGIPTEEDLENLIAKLGFQENTPAFNEQKPAPEKMHGEPQDAEDSLNQEPSVGRERESEIEKSVSDIPESDTGSIIQSEEHAESSNQHLDVPEIFAGNKPMNNKEMEKIKEREEIKRENRQEEKSMHSVVTDVDHESFEELQKKDKSEGENVVFSEDALRSASAGSSKENNKRESLNEKEEGSESPDHLKLAPDSAEKEDQIIEPRSQEKDLLQHSIKTSADVEGQEHKEAERYNEKAPVKGLMEEKKENVFSIHKRATEGMADDGFHPEKHNKGTLLNKLDDKEKSSSDQDILEADLRADEPDEDLKEVEELLEDENAASAQQSEQALKKGEKTSLDIELLNTRDELKTEIRASIDGLDRKHRTKPGSVKTKSHLLESTETKYERTIPTDEVQKGEDKEIVAQVKTPKADKINVRNIVGFGDAEAEALVGTVNHDNNGRAKLDESEHPIREAIKGQRDINVKEVNDFELREPSERNFSEVDPEFSDSVKELSVMTNYLEEKQIERFRKYLRQPNILQLEAMFLDLESELKRARMGSQEQDEIEKALDQILESSEITILHFVEQFLEERVIGDEEPLEKEIRFFDEEAALLEDIQELTYRLRQKYSTIVDSRPLPPDIRISGIDSDTEIAETEKNTNIDGQKRQITDDTEIASPDQDLKRPPWFPEDVVGFPEPEISLSDEIEDLEIEVTDQSIDSLENMEVGAMPAGATDPIEISVKDVDQEMAKDTKLDKPEVDTSADPVGQESQRKRSPWFRDIVKTPKAKDLQLETIFSEEPIILDNTETDQTNQTGENEQARDVPASEKPDLEQASPGDSDAVNGMEENRHEESPPGPSVVESLCSIIGSAKDALSPLTEILIAALPESLQPGPDFYGLPWSHFFITLLVGAVTILFWRTCLSVKSRVYQVNEKQLAEKIKVLIQEKADILQKISDYEQKIKEAKQMVKEAHKENTDLSTEALGLKDVVKGLEEINQQLGAKVRHLQLQLDTEKQQSMKKQDTIIETQKSVEKLQEVLSQHSVELSEVQISLNEAKISEQKVKTELHHLKEENGRLKKSKEQLLKEAEGWSERHSELSEQIKLYHKSQKDMEEALAYKENEIEVLSNCIMQLKQIDAFFESEPQADEGHGWDKNGGDLANGDCSDKRNEKMKIQIKQMMDVSRVKTTLSIVEEDRDLLQTKLNDEIAARHELEEQIKKLEHDTGSLNTAKARLDNECKILQQKVEILTELYQQKEMALQKKLTQEEYERQEKEQKLSVADEKAVLATEEVKVYKQRIQEMEEELQKTERSYKNQIAGHEKKAHDNWLIARTAERTLSEEKRESANLRQKLIEVNQKIAMLQRPSIVKPTPGRPEYHMAGQRGPRSRDGSFGPSPVSAGAPSPPLMVEAAGRPSSTSLNRARDAPRGAMDVNSGLKQQPHEISGRMSAPDLGPSRIPNSGPRTSSPSNMVDGLIISGSKGPPSYPGTPIMNSPIAGNLPSQPPVRFAPPPTRIPYGVRPISAPLNRGPPLPLGPRDYIVGPPPGMRDLPHGSMPPPPPDAREYVCGPLGISGHRDYPLAAPPPLLHGPRDYPPGRARDLLPPGARDYLPGPPPGTRSYPGGPTLIHRDYQGGPQPGPRDFQGGPPPGLRDYPMGPQPGVRDFPGAPLAPREYPPGLPQGSRDLQLRPPSGLRDSPTDLPPSASAQRDNLNAPDGRQ
ncbi:transport and Golgi organization protein 1 homolog isoform X2 [Ambystoma mexicanum]|uniref:transport and Golgi organization protein 1 homolog isoform X2 n=1 Tax=Ambystoma mexicanum TaxID=8296 RepID=UPI0037E78479